MAVYSYRLASGQTRWFFIIDLPSDANATVDKFAQLPWKGETAALFGRGSRRCERHGYLTEDLEQADWERATHRMLVDPSGAGRGSSRLARGSQGALSPRLGATAPPERTTSQCLLASPLTPRPVAVPRPAVGVRRCAR